MNDTSGHAVGDAFLEAVAERLKSILREGETVARLGGDEFALLLPLVDHEDSVAAVARRILGSLREPHVLGGHEFHVPTSIGIAIYPNDGDDAETLLRDADVAMYKAKEEGGDSYRAYANEMNANIVERLVKENELRHALANEEFVVYYQPQIDSSSERVVGAEALVRWQHPSKGLVLPGEFISSLEDTGLIVPLGEWVLRTACMQNKAWQEAGLPPLHVAVNFSVRQLKQPDLVKMIARVLKETRLEPRYLELEITESIAMEDGNRAAEMLERLKEMGVRISIDDFGTGYSSLGYLKRFPIDTIKIDRTFVVDINAEADSAGIAAAIIAMATVINADVIAEGVETREQLRRLTELGCRVIQGFLFNKPMPAEEFAKILRQRRPLERSAPAF